MTDVSDKRSRRRQRTILAGAIILMTAAAAAVNATAEISADHAAWRPVDLVRVGGLLLLSLVLAVRSTTAFSLIGRDPTLDDELARAHRAAAARFGFWVMLLGAIACLAASVYGVDITLPEALLALITVGAMCSALRFSLLERRADG